MTSHLQIQFWNECHIFICLLHTVHFLQQGKQAEFSIHIACPFIKKAEFIKRHPCLSSFLLHIFSGCNVSLLQFVMIATAHRENPFTGNNVFTHKLCVSIRNVFYTLYIKILLIFFCSSNERLGKKLVALYCREFFFPPWSLFLPTMERQNFSIWAFFPFHSPSPGPGLCRRYVRGARPVSAIFCSKSLHIYVGFISHPAG